MHAEICHFTVCVYGRIKTYKGSCQFRNKFELPLGNITFIGS